MKQENENSQFDKGAGKFGLPEGYFQKSAGSIINKIEWQDEHKAFPNLSALKSINAFLVPGNYFSKNESRLELSVYPVLKSLRLNNAFLVPENYFEDLNLLETTGLSGRDLEFETLRAIPKQNNFKVPEDYFSEKDLSLKQSLQKEAKVISLFSRRTGYAAAALVLIILGVWVYNIYFLSVQAVDCGTIACLDKQDLVKVKSLEVLEDEQLYELVDPTALEEKLISPETKQSKNNDLNEDSLEEFLDDI